MASQRAIQLDNRTIVPWTKLNVNNEMSILRLKNEALKSDIYQHIKHIKKI